jgi:hypothetical protein
MPPLRTVLAPRIDYGSRTYWSGTIKMGLSKFFILRVLHDGPMHGYDIARTVARVTGGCCSPTEGTIYPVLREFEAGGFLTVEEEVVQGRQRRVFQRSPHSMRIMLPIPNPCSRGRPAQSVQARFPPWETAGRCSRGSVERCGGARRRSPEED